MIYVFLSLLGWLVFLAGMVGITMHPAIQTPGLLWFVLFGPLFVFLPTFVQTGWGRKRSFLQRSAFAVPSALLALALASWLVTQNILTDGMGLGLLMGALLVALYALFASNASPLCCTSWVFPLHNNPTYLAQRTVTKTFLQHGIDPKPVLIQFSTRNDGLALLASPPIQHRALLREATDAINHAMLLSQWDNRWDHTIVGGSSGSTLIYETRKALNPTRFLLQPLALSAHEQLTLIAQQG